MLARDAYLEFPDFATVMWRRAVCVHLADVRPEDWQNGPNEVLCGTANPAMRAAEPGDLQYRSLCVHCCEEAESRGGGK